MKVYKTLSEIPMKVGNFLSFNMEIEYSEIIMMTDAPAIKYAKENVLCSVIEISKV